MLGRIDYSFTGMPIGMSPVPRIDEGAAFRVTLRALNADLAAATPATMRWHLRDMDTLSTILGWQDLTPATSVNFVVVGSRNLIRNGLKSERRQLVFEATDSDGAIRRTCDYEIQSLGLGPDGVPIVSQTGESIFSEG
jgi:hypothetical protein